MRSIVTPDDVLRCMGHSGWEGRGEGCAILRPETECSLVPMEPLMWFCTDQHLCFAGFGGYNAVLPLTDIVSLQLTVALTTYGTHRPHFLLIPSDDVVPDSLQVSCAALHRPPPTPVSQSVQ